MTGALLFDPAVEPPHTRVRFRARRRPPPRLRRSAPLRHRPLLRGAAARDAYLAARLGVEPFTPAFTAELPAPRGPRAARAPVKAFLLDQRRIAGVGNIYADEALFRAGIHPLRPAGRLTAAAVGRGCTRAIEAGAGAPESRPRAPRSTTSATSTAPAAPSRIASWFIFARGSPARRCGRPIRKIVVGGRGTYVCEHMPERPRRRRADALRAGGSDALRAGGSDALRAGGSDVLHAGGSDALRSDGRE